MTKSISFFARKTNSKLAVLFILFGTSFFWNPSAGAVQTGNATITCAKANGTQLTANVNWDNANIYFKDKGDIARLFCEGGHSGGYPIFISTSVPDGPLRFYNGVRPVLGPEPTPSPVVSESASPVPQPSPSDGSTVSASPSPTPSPEPTPTPTLSVPDSSTPSPESSMSASPAGTPTESTTPSDTSTVVIEPTVPQEPVNVPVTPPAPPAVEPEPTPAPVLTPELQPEPAPTPSPAPQPEPSPSPQPSPVVIADPAPAPVEVVAPSPAPDSEPLATPPPEPVVEEPPVLAEEPPVPVEEPPAPAEEPVVDDSPPPPPPALEEEPPAELEKEPLPPAPHDEPPVADKNATDEEKAIVAQEIIELAGENPVTAEAIQAAGLTYSDLPPATPVEVRQDENGNEVVITAEVAAALLVLENPAELLNAIFTDPAQALLALGSIGADMSPEERAESEKTVVAAVIVGQIAGQAAVTAAAGAAAYRRKP